MKPRRAVVRSAAASPETGPAGRPRSAVCRDRGSRTGRASVPVARGSQCGGPPWTRGSGGCLSCSPRGAAGPPSAGRSVGRRPAAPTRGRAASPSKTRRLPFADPARSCACRTRSRPARSSYPLPLPDWDAWAPCRPVPAGPPGGEWPGLRRREKPGGRHAWFAPVRMSSANISRVLDCHNVLSS